MHFFFIFLVKIFLQNYSIENQQVIKEIIPKVEWIIPKVEYRLHEVVDTAIFVKNKQITVRYAES